MRRPFALALAPLLAACAPPTGAPKAVAAAKAFIALGLDFASYRSWTALDRGRDRVPPTHDAHSVIYVDRIPPAGATGFGVGTRIVRVEEHGEDEPSWELHAMVKRGGGFNAEGARGWEFFELSHRDDGPPVIVWRGEGPPTGDGYRPADGSDDVLGCNHCHGSWPENDSVLSPVLDLRTLHGEGS